MTGLPEEERDERGIRHTIKNLVVACMWGEIQKVQEIVASKEVDINDSWIVWTPLIRAMTFNQVEIVSYLLTLPELQLDKRTHDGLTALHMGAFTCALPNGCVSVVRLFCQDRRCTPSVVNMKDINGRTALMRAVENGCYEIVKELDKVEGTDFRTKDRHGSTLIEIARKNDHVEIVEFLQLRNKKVESLKVITAYSLAKYLKNKSDVEELDIPCTIKPLVEGFIDHSKSDEVEDNVNNSKMKLEEEIKRSWWIRKTEVQKYWRTHRLRIKRLTWVFLMCTEPILWIMFYQYIVKS